MGDEKIGTEEEKIDGELGLVIIGPCRLTRKMKPIWLSWKRNQVFFGRNVFEGISR